MTCHRFNFTSSLHSSTNHLKFPTGIHSCQGSRKARQKPPRFIDNNLSALSVEVCFSQLVKLGSVEYPRYVLMHFSQRICGCHNVLQCCLFEKLAHHLTQSSRALMEIGCGFDHTVQFVSLHFRIPPVSGLQSAESRIQLTPLRPPYESPKSIHL